MKNENIRNGFTLLEVMVATAILAIGLTSIISLYSISVRSLSIVKGYEEARIEAETVMSETLANLYNVPFTKNGNCKWNKNIYWQASGEKDELIKGVNIISVKTFIKSSETVRSFTIKTAQVDKKLPKKIASLEK